MILNAHWPSILESARLGDLEPARHGREVDPSGPLADYFYGRALAEAGVQLDEAIACLQRAALAERDNPAFIHSLALALARSEIHTNRAAAAEIWKKEGLPLDLDLLAQVSLTLEAQIRPWPEEPSSEPPWPASLPEPGADPIIHAAENPEPEDRQNVEIQNAIPALDEGQSSSSGPNGDKMSRPPVTKKLGPLARWRLGRATFRLENFLMDGQPLKVLEESAALLDRGLETPELHLVAGLAAEAAGLARRARAHLSRADRLEPGMFLARTWLGRIYWREGWFDLALALWRSVPVEGPYDYGRHYHMALAHDALGDRPAALAAMGVALDRFYFDTRHFYVKRAMEEWQQRYGSVVSG